MAASRRQGKKELLFLKKKSKKTFAPAGRGNSRLNAHQSESFFLYA
jgi:hypothetical protein